MIEQRSFSLNEFSGVLYLVPTPIGNLRDMTLRAIDVLKEVDLIAAEDTRNTRKLCNHFEITTSMVSYHEFSSKKEEDKLINKLLKGAKIALVSDAGMPAISDPGYDIVNIALKKSIKVISLPGASAGITGLVASGLVPCPFSFFGFLNRKKEHRRLELDKLRGLAMTLIFYESPHRISEMLQDVYYVFGNRRVVVARELTKYYETYIRGDLAEVCVFIAGNKVKGELVIIVEGSSLEATSAINESWWNSLTIFEHVKHYIEIDGAKPIEAIKQVTRERKISRKQVYNEFHGIK